MFRQGLGLYMLQELTSLAREFIQQREPRTPYPEPRRPDIIPPEKYAMSAECYETETDVEELLNITQLSDQSLSDSDNEDINKAVKDNLGEHPPKSATDFHDRFGYHSLDDIFELPNIDDENKKFLQQLAKTTTETCVSDSTSPKAELPNKLNPNDVDSKSTAQLQALFTQDVILQHPSACMAAMEKDDTFSVIWDSGASMCISGDKRDFIGKIKPLANVVVKGIVSGLKIEGMGHVRWSVLDTEGKLRHLKLPAYYVPKTRQRLLSTSVFCKVYP